jgi:molecular chaperone HtpG
VDHTFQVDLRGVVDLLSNHLYASPRVYLRELLQNAVDALTARTDGPPPAVSVRTGDGTLSVSDNGIGLTEAQVHELLATIGRSGKRDELGFARQEFLGQFGIGLLSAFLVADEVRVVTRSATGGPALGWVGRADGTYRVEPADRDEPGSTVTLTARHGCAQWFDPTTVTELARLYGSMLPVPVTVDGTPVTDAGPPWRDDDRPAGTPRADLVGYAQDVLGFTPFDVIELSVPAAGLTGVAYVLPFAANPAERARHRVYLKRMLLAESVDGLLPEWAFFVRCVVDATELRPTASRESLYADDALAATQEAIGAQLRGWLVRLADTDPDRLARFLAVHHLGVKALAVHDDEMLRLVAQWWPMETNVGRITLAEFAARYGEVRYAQTADEFRALAAVAAAQDVPVLNGGYTYDAEIVARFGALPDGPTVRRLDPSELATRFDPLPAEVELPLQDFRRIAQRAVDELGCEVVLRSFEPATVPALYLVDRSAAHATALQATKAQVDEVWAGVLDAFAKPAQQRPQLVLNHRNDLVRRVCGLRDERLAHTATQALYGQALLLGHHPVRPADVALINRSFLGLLDAAVPPERDERA